MYRSIFSPATWQLTFVIILLILWSTFWKGLALWKAARAKQKYWFVAILVINSLGLLEIVYLGFFQKRLKGK